MADPFKKKKKEDERTQSTDTGTGSVKKPSVYKPNANKATTTQKTTTPTSTPKKTTTTPLKQQAQEQAKKATGATRQTDSGTRATSRIDYLGALGHTEPEKVEVSKATQDWIDRETKSRTWQLQETNKKLTQARNRWMNETFGPKAEEHDANVAYWEYVKNAKEQAAMEPISLQNAIAEQKKKTALLGWNLKEKEQELFRMRTQLAALSDQVTAKPVDYGSVAGVGEPGGRGVHSAEKAAEALELQDRIKQLEQDLEQAKTYQYYSKGNDVLSALQKTNYSAYKYIDTMAQYPADYYLKNNTDGGSIDDGELLQQIRDNKDAAAAEAKALLKKMGYSDKDIEQLVDFRVRQINEEHMLNLIATSQQMAKDSPVGASIASVATNIPAGIGYVDAAIQRVKNPDRPIDYNAPAMSTGAMTNAIRGQVSQDLIDKYGEKGKGYSFLYQSGMSMVDSTIQAGLAGLGVPPSVGLVLMGGSAATTTLQEAHSRGLSDDQALLLGFVAGAAEYLTERVELKSLLDIVNGRAGKEAMTSVMGGILKQAHEEGKEEVISDVVNFISEALITGDKSELNQRIREAEALGYSHDQAVRMAVNEQLQSTLLSYAGGALSGGVMGGLGGAYNAGVNAKINADYYAALSTASDSDAYAAAKNLQKVVDELSQKKTKDITAADHVAYATAVDNLHTALDALPAEDLAAAKKAGKTLQKEASSYYKLVTKGSAAIRDALRKGTKSDTQLDTHHYSSDAVVQDAATLVATGEQNKVVTAISNVMKNEAAQKALGLTFEGKISTTAKRTRIREALEQLVKTTQETQLAEQGAEPAVEVNNSKPGATVEEGQTPAEATAVSAEGVDEDDIDLDKVQLPETLPSYEEYERGVLGHNPDATTEQIRQDYNELARSYEEDQQAKKVFQNATEEIAQFKRDAAERRGKKVYLREAKRAVGYTEYVALARQYTHDDGSAWTQDELRAAFDAGVTATMEDVSKYEVKRRSKLEKVADRITKGFEKNNLGLAARVSYGDESLMTGTTWHAYYDSTTNSVVFNGDVLNSEAEMLYYLGHEVVHPSARVDANLVEDIIQMFQELYQEGKLKGELAKKLQNMDTELANLKTSYQNHENALAKKADRKARTYTDAEIREEFAADLMRAAFANTKLFKDIAKKQSGILTRMRDTVARVVSATEGDNETQEGLKKIAERLDEALAMLPNGNLAVHDPETASASDLTPENIENLNEENGGRLFSLATMKQDLDGYMQDLRDAGLVGDGKVMTTDELDRLYKDINAVMDYVEKHILEIERSEAYRTMTADNRPFSPFKPNSDPHYKMALDYSTLCRKRLLTQAITERLQQALKRALTPVEQVKIRDMLKDLQKKGKQIDVACALCYVEAARLKSPKVINDFLDHRAESIWRYHSLKDSTFKHDVYEKRAGDWKEQHGLPRNATKEMIKKAGFKESEFNKFLDQIRKTFPDWLRKNNPERYAELETQVKAAEKLDKAEFLSAQSLARMRGSSEEGMRDVYDAFIAKVRAATRSKAQETDVPYVRGDASQISQNLIDQMNEESGFRHQSWSDFQAMHLLDTVAAIMELSVRGAKMHTYTKVADMVRFLGDTGLMINMSLIPAGETGFDENGNLAFDPVEGFVYETMLELRRKFHATAGNIAIGISDDQIRAMMASDEIDYIIPYHTSGLNADMRRRMGIKAWKDYTNSQNEKGDDWDKKAPKLREWYNERDAVLAPDGVAYMVEASKKYLQLCHERGLVPKFAQFLQKNSDGSYSLKDDAQNYWKLLIDRKMVDQYTGGIIVQQAVKPKFDRDTMLDILDKEVNSQAAIDAREAEDYVVGEILKKGLGVISKAERAKLEEQARVLRDVTARAVVEMSAEEMGIGKPGQQFSIAYGSAASDESRSAYSRAQDMILDYTMQHPDSPLTDEEWENIRKETGWWKGPYDHQWRYWISDDDAEWTAYAEKARAAGQYQFTLYDLLSHDRLFQDYPGLEDITVSFDLPKGTTLGYFGRGEIHLPADAELNDETFGTLLHEVQHAIQRIEIDNYNSIQGGSSQDVGYKQAFVVAYRDLTNNGADTSMFDGLSYKQAVRKIERHIVKMYRSEPAYTEQERQRYLTDPEFPLTEEELDQLEAEEAKRRREQSDRDVVQGVSFQYYEEALGEIDARMTGDLANINRYLARRGSRPRNDREFADARIEERLSGGEETRRGGYYEIREDINDFQDISRSLGWDGDPKHLHSTNYELAESRGSSAEGDRQFALSPKFEQDYDRWVTAGKPGSWTLLVGTTPEEFSKIGLSPKKVRWNTSKLRSIQKKHPYMTDDLLKQASKMIDNPVLVLASKTQANSVVMFGEVYVKDPAGRDVPVMAALELSPTSDGYELNEYRVASSYAKEKPDFVPNLEATQSFLDSSRYLFIDPDIERTQNWLDRTGLQLPFPSDQYGFIDIITLVPKNSKGQFEFGGNNTELPDWKKKLQGLLDEMDTDTEASEDSGASSVGGQIFSIDHYHHTALLTESTVDEYLAAFAAKTSPNYAKAYIAWMSPDQFLRLTTSSIGRHVVEAQSTELDAEKFAETTRHQPIQLRINHETGEVEGHEGRHRAVALSRAGVSEIPVLFFDSSNKNSKTAIDSLDLQGQDFGSSRSYASVTVEGMIPLSYANRDTIIEQFATKSRAQEIAEKYGSPPQLQYSLSSEEDDLFQAFVAAYEDGQGAGQLERDYPTIQQQLREARREQKRAQKRADSENAKRLVAQKATKEAKIAWEMYHKRVLRKTRRDLNDKVNQERKARAQAVREAVAQTKEVERAKAAVDMDAQRMAAGREAAKRLGIREDTYGKKNQERKEKEILRRNAAKATLRNQAMADRKRAQIEAEQGPVDTMRKSPQERSFRQKLSDAAEKLRVTGRDLYAKFVSQAAEIERVGKRQTGMRADTLATILGGVGSTVNYIFSEGLVDRAGDTIGGSMTDVFLCTVEDKGTVIDEPRQALFQDYLLHRHNIDRMSFVERALERLEAMERQHPWLREADPKEIARLAALTDAEAKKLGQEQAREIARIYNWLNQSYLEAKNKPVFADTQGNPISADTSRGRVAQLEQEAPWLVEKAKGVDEWWDKFMRAWVVGDSISEEQYAHMRAVYPHYVPTYRVDKGGACVSFFAGKGLSPGKYTREAVGSVKEIVNVEDSFANLVQKAVRQARANELFKNLVDTAMLDNDGTFADSLYFDWIEYGQNAGAGDLARMDIGEDLEHREGAGLTKDGDGYRVSAWYNGELVHCYVSEALYKSLSLTTGHSSDRLDKVARLGSKLTAPMKTAITGINPNFALRNVMRDVPTAIVNSTSGLAFPKWWAIAWKEMIARSDNWRHYQALGGGDALYYNNEGGYGANMNMRAGAKGKAQRGWNKVKAVANFINESTESVTRFAEYLATIDKLGDTYEGRLQARKNAAEVTVDFSRHGEYGKAINAWIPYWNPAVQGIDKVFRSVVETPQGQTKLGHALRTLGKAAVTTALVEAVFQIIYTALGKRKDWEQLDDRTKDTYYCIPTGDHKFIKIPKNREWGAILGTPLMRLWEWGYGGRENPFENYLETSIFPNFLPGMPLTFDDGKIRSDIIGISQALDIANNSDFAGRTIVPYAYQQGSKKGQYDSDTSNFSKWLSDAIGNMLSPMQVDYIFKDYFGDFGKMFTMATSGGLWSGEKTPEEVAAYALDIVKNPWVADNRFSNQYTSRYYEVMDELEDKYNDIKNHEDGDAYKDSIEYQTYQAITKLYGKEITALNKAIRNETNEDKKAEAKAQIVDLVKAALDYYDSCMGGKIKRPDLAAEYDALPQGVSDALINLDSYAGDYGIRPSEYNSKTISDTTGLKIGNSYIMQYELDDAAKDKYNEIRQAYYDEYLAKVASSSSFKSAKPEDQASMLEDARSDAYSAASDEFHDWLKKNRTPTMKPDKDLPAAYRALSDGTKKELANLAGQAGTEKYTYTPSDSTTKSYTDPTSKVGKAKATREYVLDDEAMDYHNKLRQQYYETYVSRVMQSAAYRNASAARKAEMLADARSNAYEQAKEEFMTWLQANRTATPRD